MTQVYYSNTVPTTRGTEGVDNQYAPISPVHLEATISLPTGQTITLATLKMLSISKHRETFPVTSLGYVRPQAFTRGHRLVAGTMVFSVFERGAFQSLLDPLEAPSAYVNKRDEVRQVHAQNAFFDMSPDQLPPFDVHAVYVTPQGLVCYEGLRGVVIVDEGSIRSIDIPEIQESYSYMALDRIPLQRLSDINKANSQSRKTDYVQNPYTQNLLNLDAVANALTLLK